MAKLFGNILSDNVSGSGTILDGIINNLSDYLQKNGKIDIRTLSAELDEVLEKFPGFALLRHFVSVYKREYENRGEADSKDVQNFIFYYRKKYDGAQQKVSERFIEKVNLNGKSVLLHSNSSAIKNLFETLKRKNIFPEVWQTVSSPANEGVIQGEFLNKLGYNVNLFHEDAVSLFIKKIDMALFGADMVFNDFFVNKTGTYPLCLMMKEFGKKVYVIAEERKKIDIRKTDGTLLNKLLAEHPKPENELAKINAGTIKVHNYYFEKIPLSSVNEVFL